MDPASRRFSMNLEPGTSFESQNNANYAYLNRQGISMPEYLGILSDVATVCRQGVPRQGFGDIPTAFRGPQALTTTRADGKIETIGYRAYLDGRDFNPITGEIIWGHPDYFLTVRAARHDQDTPRTEEESIMALHFGFTEMELEMARYGVFDARAVDPQASCRAEEILERIRNTETGSQVLAQRAANQLAPAGQQIELMSEPRPAETIPATGQRIGALALARRIIGRLKR
jgi:hypothetical protein